MNRRTAHLIAIATAILSATTANAQNVPTTAPTKVPATAAQAPATAAAKQPAPKAHVYHVPPAETDPDEPLLLAAIVHNAWTEKALVVRYRAMGGREYQETAFERSSTGEYIATIAAEHMVSPGIQYFVVGIAQDGSERTHIASKEWPHDVRIETPTGRRWIAIEKERLANRRNRLRTRVSVQQFLRRSDAFSNQPDFYRRGEFDVTHRLVDTLYSFTIGFGYLYGNTPLPAGAGPWTRGIRRARYGYGGIRLRFHESVYLDAQAILGYSHNGTMGGARAEFTFGRYWASNVKVGAEIIGDFASRAWVRLQWDTVSPLLMAAQLTADNFPDASIGAGSTVSFETTYPFGNGVSITGIVSYATRGRRVGAFGGGLQTSIEF